MLRDRAEALRDRYAERPIDLSVSEANDPSVNEVNGLSESEANGPSVSKVNGPSESEANGPSVSKVNGPSESAANDLPINHELLPQKYSTE